MPARCCALTAPAAPLPCSAVEREGSSAATSPARLLVGSLHDDALLVCRCLALDQFPSPLVLRTRTRAPVKEKGAAVQVRRTKCLLCPICLLCDRG